MLEINEANLSEVQHYSVVKFQNEPRVCRYLHVLPIAVSPMMLVVTNGSTLSTPLSLSFHTADALLTFIGNEHELELARKNIK